MTENVTMPTRRQFLEHLGTVGGTSLVLAGMNALGFSIDSSASQVPVLSGGGKKRIAVLGAGLAGLTCAYELSNAGYEVVLLEARGRPGGRAYTARYGTRHAELGGEDQVCTFAGGNYINMGAWRVPHQHHAYLHYARTLGVPLELMNNDNDHSYIFASKGTGPLASTPVRKQQIAADSRGYAAELLAKQINQGALDEAFSAKDREQLLEYLRSDGQLTAKDFRYVGCDGRGFDTNPGAGLAPGQPSRPFSFTDVLHSETWRALRSVADFEEPRTMFQPTGGMDRLPYAFTRRLGNIIRYENVVERIRQSDSAVDIDYSTKGRRGTLSADYCICALPLSVLRNIDLHVSPAFKDAIDSTSYDTAGKMGIQMRRRFWEEDHGIYGGHIYFDDPDIHTISLPSTGWLGQKGVGTRVLSVQRSRGKD
jgi:monoamine oxidase